MKENLVSENMEIEFCQVCAVIVLLSTTYQISAQCPRRNQTKADAVGRPCRKPCPSQAQCKDGKICRCDHECGTSCINMNNFCGLPLVIPNMARVCVYRRLSNGSLVLKPSPPYQYDDMAEYECAHGYRLEGSQNFNLCHGRKSWTRLAVCARSCRRFDEEKVLQNLMICGTNCVTSSECTEDMSCMCDGYCGRTCVNPDIDCGEAPPSTHASIKYDGEGFQRRAYYRCDVGFYPQSGDLTRKCTGGGTWSGRLINCAPTTCGDPLPSIRSMGGEIVQDQHDPYLVGHQVTFQCSPGQRFLGDSVQTCMEDGQWSGLNAICDLIDDESRCPHPGVPINGNLLTRSNFTVGTMVEFECDEGYSMIGDRQQECFYFLQWSDGGAPKCIDPRYPASNSVSLRRLQGNLETTEDLVHSHSLGHSLSSTSTILHETIFVIDISKDVSDETLRVSLKFAENLVIEASRDNYLKCAIIVFASGSKVVLRFASVPSQEVIQSLRSILADREKFVQNVGELRNTAEGLRKLREVYLSIAQNISENMRNIFLFINGQHFQGLISPKIVMQDFIDGLSKNLPNIYVIAFGSNVHESATYDELQSLTYPRHLLLVNPTSTEVPDTFNSQDFCQCGTSGDIGNVKKRASIGRVVKGTKANLAAWPWQVLIAENRARISNTYRRVRGGGSLINHRWVLTAAHIFHGMARPRDWAHNILLTFGIRQLPESDQSQLSSHVQVFRAKKIYEHENFSINTFDYDIALILVGRELKQLGLYWQQTGNAGWVNYTSFVRPVCLPCMDRNCVSEYLERNERTLFGRKISESDKCKTEGDWLIEKGELERKSVLTVVTGFGEKRIRHTSDFKFKASKFLTQALIRLHNDERCNRSIAQMRKKGLPEGITFTDQMICGIGGNPGIITDACKGDSGGPLVREFKENVIGKGCWMQIGIVSWGWGCGSTYTENSIKHQFPGYYTSVALLMSWVTEIQQQTKSVHPDSFCHVDPCQVEKGRTCKKSCEDDADCRGALKRCVCDDVCGMSCINPKAVCDDLDTLSNGTIEGNRTYGNTVYYTCNEGFILKGTRTRTCRSDKKWTGTAPTCLEIECVVPRAPSFGSVEPPSFSRVALDEIITYSCGRRYRLVGTSRATCKEDRTFASSPPRCQEITCPHRTTPAHARPSSFKSRWLVDEVLSYTCALRYDFRGNPSSTCLVSGSWSNTLPYCHIRRCVHRDVPEHSTANPNKSQWVYGDRVTYTCDRGYELSGSAESRCTSSGRWSDPPPTCTIRSCEHPTPPRNVDIIRPANKMSWVYEDTITYGCSRGYRLNGARTLSCTEDGTWSHPVPTCQQITCERSDPDFGESIPRKERYIFDEKITYSCNDGFILEGAIRSICQTSGSWNNDPPNCYLPELECVVPRAPSFGSVEPPRYSRVALDNIITYSCGRKYRLVGNSRATCKEDRTFTSPPPRCDEITCPRRTTPAHATPSSYKSRWVVDEVLNYTCDVGYELRGNPSSTCLVSGGWSNELPNCRIQRCVHRDSPEHSTTNPNKSQWVYGDRVTYTCDRGYELSGSAESRCTSSGRWSDPPPTCTSVDECQPRPCRNGGTCLNRIDAYKCYCLRGYEGEIECVVPRTPSFGSVEPPSFSRVALDNIITYSCGRKYRLVGNSRATCEEDRTFTSPPPRCDEITCPRRTTPAHARPSSFKSRWVVDDVLSYTCALRYDFRGNPSSTCLVSGSWSNTLPYCHIRRCVHRHVPEHSTANPNKSQWVYGDRVTYTCDRGYELSGSAESRCTSSGRWSDPPPTCTSIKLSCSNVVVPVRTIVGSIKFPYVAGDSITYSCEAGYNMMGPATIVCQNTGRWSSNPPSCV
ncbi:uncharacterized protein LOC143468462 isoform X2 [Clavelina lepadiformis]|uniref:uncharacterized protein LOC143468460 isoform X2 n=1 Tax=Clavelina lepadiformis TaxID=159417 RepID=UPI00404184C9